MNPSSLDSAREFLRAKRIAFVGVSRDDKDFSRYVFREFTRRGYDCVPVNPSLSSADGRACFARIRDVWPPPEAALLMTPPARTEEVLRDCVAAGVRRIWLHRGGGPGAASPEALAYCEAQGLDVVRDLCPFMALPGSGLPHRLHGFLRRTLHRSR